MAKLVHSHSCENFILTCIDFRFQKAISEWIKQNNWEENYDLLSIAGTQKNAVDSATKDFFLNQLAISVRLHSPKVVVLVAHQDCGAYGGSTAFGNWDEEKAKYMEDLNAAEAAIKEKFPEMEVKKVIAVLDAENNISFEQI